MSDPSAIWHPMTQHGLMPPEIYVERAQGAYLYGREGRRIVDGISSWWVITHGHCHPDIVKAVQGQAAQLEQVIFSGFTHGPAEDLTKALLGFCNSAHEFVFYSDSGSTAVEVAMKMAIGYWGHKGQPRTRVLALENGYHGDTFGTMSAGARGVFNAAYEPFLFETDHIPVPVPGAEDEALSKLEALLQARGEEYAAFIFEPLVQGAAGMLVYSPAMLKAMCDLCKRYGILLIADEVMTGFGRTGSFFACDQAGITVDLMALSKGITGGFLPMGATLATRDIYMAFYSQDRAKTFFHSTSFTANALACAAALASLQIWQNEDVLGRIGAITAQQEAFAARISAHERVAAVRQKGSVFALDIAIDDGHYLSDLTPRLQAAFLKKDILLRPIGGTIYILPPYCAGEQDMEEIYLAIEAVLSEQA